MVQINNYSRSYNYSSTRTNRSGSAGGAGSTGSTGSMGSTGSTGSMDGSTYTPTYDGGSLCEIEVTKTKSATTVYVHGKEGGAIHSETTLKSGVITYDASTDLKND